MKCEDLSCKACAKGKVTQFIDFGKMPVSNFYPSKEDIENNREYLWNMAVGMCENCKMVQLTEFVPYEKYLVPKDNGGTEYAFHSSLSRKMVEHFAKFAEEIETRFIDKNKRVAEIGGNDGIMLQAFPENYLRVNIEPASNVAEISRKKGIMTLEEFFTPTLAKDLTQRWGKFAAVTSSNVVLNIHDLNGVAEGISQMLDDKGVFVMQDPYLGRILEDNAYDQIYDEHVWYFSLTSLQNIFKEHGLEIFDSNMHEVHGGSMRVFMGRSGEFTRTERCKSRFDYENSRGMDRIDTYRDFAKKTQDNKNKLNNFVSELKEEGKRIAGYAAASKGTVILNYAGIGPEKIDFVADSTPDKQGKYIPGVHIPIVSPDYFKNNPRDYTFIGARNHVNEILNKERTYTQNGGKFFISLPEIKIFD